MRGGVTQIFFVFQDLKICTSFFDVQIFYLCLVRGLCTIRFHPLLLIPTNDTVCVEVAALTVGGGLDESQM